MRLGHALLVVAACGGRVEREPRVEPYKVIFASESHGIRTWHSATSELTNVDTTLSGSILRCTYDGHYIGVSDYLSLTSDVIDANGALVRHQPSGIDAIRPDGMRTFIQGYSQDPNHYCVGTLDADGTYGNEQCSAQAIDIIAPFAYAPDGKTVLWLYGVEAETWTLATGLEDGTNRRQIVSPVDGLYRAFIAGAFSFDGSRVAYVECSESFTDKTFVCQLKTVRLDTLETKIVVDEGTQLTGVAFTPDGKKIVFGDTQSASIDEIGMSIRIVDLETDAISTLLEHPNTDALDTFCVARGE